MPNWCQNYVDIYHKDRSKLDEIVQTSQNEEDFFKHFLPCPEGEVESDIWGTKWDVQIDEDDIFFEEDDKILNINFESAWSPPIPFFRYLESIGYDIKSYFYEPGFDILGSYINGVETYYNQSEDNIPEDIQWMFGLNDIRDNL